ncbi:hypothetical protein G6F23_015149 [Rhizopus arrhizus]|nr:hypothetical protein G6F23_015149 [Rhizopus arrhizus]
MTYIHPNDRVYALERALAAAPAARPGDERPGAGAGAGGPGHPRPDAAANEGRLSPVADPGQRAHRTAAGRGGRAARRRQHQHHAAGLGYRPDHRCNCPRAPRNAAQQQRRNHRLLAHAR